MAYSITFHTYIEKSLTYIETSLTNSNYSYIVITSPKELEAIHDLKAMKDSISNKPTKVAVILDRQYYLKEEY